MMGAPHPPVITPLAATPAWFDYALNPQLLDDQLDEIVKNQNKETRALELINLFLENLPQREDSRRRQKLLHLAAKVAIRTNLRLEDIEKGVAPGLQWSLLSQLRDETGTIDHACDLFRWAVRAVVGGKNLHQLGLSDHRDDTDLIDGTGPSTRDGAHREDFNDTASIGSAWSETGSMVEVRVAKRAAEAAGSVGVGAAARDIGANDGADAAANLEKALSGGSWSSGQQQELSKSLRCAAVADLAEWYLYRSDLQLAEAAFMEALQLLETSETSGEEGSGDVQATMPCSVSRERLKGLSLALRLVRLALPDPPPTPASRTGSNKFQPLSPTLSGIVSDVSTKLWVSIEVARSKGSHEQVASLLIDDNRCIAAGVGSALTESYRTHLETDPALLTTRVGSSKIRAANLIAWQLAPTPAVWSVRLQEFLGSGNGVGGEWRLYEGSDAEWELLFQTASCSVKNVQPNSRIGRLQRWLWTECARGGTKRWAALKKAAPDLMFEDEIVQDLCRDGTGVKVETHTDSGVGHKRGRDDDGDANANANAVGVSSDESLLSDVGVSSILAWGSSSSCRFSDGRDGALESMIKAHFDSVEQSPSHDSVASLSVARDLVRRVRLRSASVSLHEDSCPRSLSTMCTSDTTRGWQSCMTPDDVPGVALSTIISNTLSGDYTDEKATTDLKVAFATPLSADEKQTPLLLECLSLLANHHHWTSVVTLAELAGARTTAMAKSAFGAAPATTGALAVATALAGIECDSLSSLVDASSIEPAAVGNALRYVVLLFEGLATSQDAVSLALPNGGALLKVLRCSSVIKLAALVGAGVLQARRAVKNIPFESWMKCFGAWVPAVSRYCSSEAGGPLMMHIDDSTLLECWQGVAERAAQLCPHERRWALGVADTFFEQRRFRLSIQHYLLSVSASSLQFDDEARDPLPDPVLRNLVTALDVIGAHAEALLLSQCTTQMDYDAAFTRANKHFSSLQAPHIALVFDFPLLEKLIQVATSHGDEFRATGLLRRVGDPLFNQGNEPDVIAAATAKMRARIFRLIAWRHL